MPKSRGFAGASSPATRNRSFTPASPISRSGGSRAVSAHLNGGFARAADLKAADVMTDVSGADGLIEAEDGAIAHMNDDHADAVRLYATRLLGAPDGAWRLTGLDPEGLDLALGDTTLRLPFAQRVTTAEALRKAVVDLAAKARAA